MWSHMHFWHARSDAYDQTAQYSTQIFSLAVLLSSLFVYNQVGRKLARLGWGCFTRCEGSLEESCCSLWPAEWQGPVNLGTESTCASRLCCSVYVQLTCIAVCLRTSGMLYTAPF